MDHDYYVVGAGMFGSVFARDIAEQGRKVCVFDSRPHPGGNCWSHRDPLTEIEVHAYGPHIFHTNSDYVWNFVNRFGKFWPYIHRVKSYASINGSHKVLSFPINLTTLYEITEGRVNTPEGALDYFKFVTKDYQIGCERNLEAWALSQVGKDIYEAFIEGYTKKQWGREPKDLPASILKRIPIRTTWNDQYFNDTYQGIPIRGYGNLFYSMLDHPNISLMLKDEFDVKYIRNQAIKSKPIVVYTGGLDALFDYDEGPLQYRTLNFESQTLNQEDYQGISIINYPGSTSGNYTRVIEHKHFMNHKPKTGKTIVTTEFPAEWQVGKIPFYPVDNDATRALWERYRARAQSIPKLITGGRLADFRYYDMHHVVASALQTVKRCMALE